MTTVLKLGGSVITDKHAERTVATDRLDTIARLLADADDALVLVIGGGSFGHPAADRHGMTAEHGTTDPAAIAEVHGAMLDLVSVVVDRFVSAGVRAIVMHPLSLAHRDIDGLQVAVDAVDAAIVEGFVPVLHGDGVVTDGRGVTILSGDDLVVEAAALLGAERVGLCTGVPGVLDTDGRVIDRIDRLEDVHHVLGESDATDVTGGMAGKVQTLLERDLNACLFGLDGLEAFLAGGRPGTTIGDDD